MAHKSIRLYFTPSKLDEFEKDFKTVLVDGDGQPIPIEYNEKYVRGTVLKLISDVRLLLDENERLQQIRYNATEAHVTIQSRQAEEIEQLQADKAAAVEALREIKHDGSHELIKLNDAVKIAESALERLERCDKE